jgi:hypothetical protein
LDVAVTKDGGKIEAITGATITSRAVTDAISNYSAMLMKKLPEKSPALDSTEAKPDTIDTEIPEKTIQENPEVKG